MGERVCVCVGEREKGSGVGERSGRVAGYGGDIAHISRHAQAYIHTHIHTYVYQHSCTCTCMHT